MGIVGILVIVGAVGLFELTLADIFAAACRPPGTGGRPSQRQQPNYNSNRFGATARCRFPRYSVASLSLSSAGLPGPARSSSPSAEVQPCHCRRPILLRCCSGRCSPQDRSTCAKLTVGRRLPQTPSINRLTSLLTRYSQLPEITSRRLPTHQATAPVRLARESEIQVIVLQPRMSSSTLARFQRGRPGAYTLRVDQLSGLLASSQLTCGAVGATLTVAE